MIALVLAVIAASILVISKIGRWLSTSTSTTFAPNKPATNSNLHIVTENEARMDMDAALRDCLKNTYLIDTETLERTEVPLLIDIYEKHFAQDWCPKEIE
jgi:hypothetical protein